jgi:hypothetical protein
MKRIKMFVFLFLLMVLLQSNAWVKLTLVRPAEIVLPKYIKSFVIIDRTKQIESNQTKLEQTLSGELFHQDEQAVGQLVEGTINLCNGFQRFSFIRSGERYIGGGTKNTFPTPLDWSEVQKHCQKHSADAVLSIEILDSDFIITNNPFEEIIKDQNGKELVIPKIKAVGVAVVNVGLRLYDPVSKQIIDEYRITERLNFDASGNTIQDAVNSMLNKTEAINQVSYNAGYAFGKRISPYYYTVQRDFYNKPKKSKYIQQGVRKSEVADWNGAIESWMKVFDSKNKKDRKALGKAAFNIAVAYEVLGDLDKAKEWAAKSYTDYEDEEADNYYKKLQYRIREEAILKTQLGE